MSFLEENDIDTSSIEILLETNKDILFIHVYSKLDGQNKLDIYFLFKKYFDSENIKNSIHVY